MAQLQRIFLQIQDMQFRSLGQEDPLEEEMTTLSSILAWRIPWTVKPWVTVHGAAESQTQLKQLSMTLRKELVLSGPDPTR